MLYAVLLAPLLGAGGGLIWWSKRKIYPFQRGYVVLIAVAFAASLGVNLFFWRDLPSYFDGGEIIETRSAVVTERQYRRSMGRTYAVVDGSTLWGLGEWKYDTKVQLYKTALRGYRMTTIPEGQNMRICYLPHTKMLLKIEVEITPDAALVLPFLASGARYETLYSWTGWTHSAGDMVLLLFLLLVAGCLAIPAVIWHNQGREE